MTSWRLLCRKCNQPKLPQVLMNYRGLGEDNDLSVLPPLATMRDKRMRGPWESHTVSRRPTNLDRSAFFESWELLLQYFFSPCARIEQVCVLSIETFCSEAVCTDSSS